MIVEDELDIMHLYKDFSRKGFAVIVCSIIADEVLTDYEKYLPELVVIEYIPGKKNGQQAARKILCIHTLAPILLMIAFENVKKEIIVDDFFIDKNSTYFDITCQVI